MNDTSVSSKGPSYRSAKEELAKSAGRVRVYGIELDRPDDKTTIPIWLCGYRSDNTDQRIGSKRIVHIPAESILQRGQVKEFVYEGFQVEWFDVEPHARLLEECFLAFEAASLHDSEDKGSGLTVLERMRNRGSHFLPLRGLINAPIIIPLEPPPNPGPIIIPLEPPPNPGPIIIPLEPPPNPGPIITPLPA